MTMTANAPSGAEAPHESGAGEPQAPNRGKSAKAAKPLPIWLRTPPKKPIQRKPAPTPREIRWWIGVLWLLVSALLLGFVAHVTLVGSLQHSRSQYLLYNQLRTELALATTPNGQLDVDGKLVANGTPIALLTIDRIHVNEVVVQGTRSGDLAQGPGHRRDTVMPGQEGTSVIMGRQATYGGPFGYLNALVPGDEITVVTGQGTSKFTVFGVRRDGDPLPETINTGAGRLELITADGIPLAPSGALHIDAALTSDVHTTPSAVFTKEVLDPSELTMAIDPSGWFSALFWFQWLAVAVIALRWVRSRWGRWQTWMIAVPALLALGAVTANAAIAMLPNLL